MTLIPILKSTNNNALCVSNHQGSIYSLIHSIMRPAQQKFRSGALYLYLIHFGRVFQTPSAQNSPIVTSIRHCFVNFVVLWKVNCAFIYISHFLTDFAAKQEPLGPDPLNFKWRQVIYWTLKPAMEFG